MRLFTFFILLLTFSSFGQKFADKEFYLVDSLVYDNISPEYQALIDNSLTQYHSVKTDMERITWVNQIVKLCWDENVWPKYNQWVYEYATQRLKEPQVDSVRVQLLQALAGAIYYIGWNYSVQTDYDKCIYYYDKCTDIYIEIGDSIGIANSLDNIGAIYIVKGEFAKALDYHAKGLVIREQIGDSLGMGASLNNIGLLHMGHGDYQSAFDDFKRALKLHQDAQFISGVSTALSNLGTIEFYFGKYENSLEYYQQGLYINEQLGDKQGMASSHTHIGAISMIQGDYPNALEQYQQSLSFYQEIGDKHGIASTLCSIGYVYKNQGKLNKAEAYFNQSLSIAVEIGAAIQKRNSLTGLFYLQTSQGDLAQAENQLEQIIAMRRNDVRVNFAVLPEREKEFYFSTMSEDFDNLYAFALIRKNDNPQITELAYNNALKLKGLLLKSTTAMRDAILESEDSNLIELYMEWIDLKKQIAEGYATGADIAETEKQANALEEELVIHSAAFSDFNKKGDLEWRDIQNKLKENEAAIEFIHFNTQIGNPNSPVQYAALVLTPQSNYPKMITLCTANELETVLGVTQANNVNYVNAVYGTKAEPNTKLYQLIWQPLEAQLKGIETVYFSPTGLLHKIAFSAVGNGPNSFLCDQYTLVQLSSTGQLALNKPYTFSTTGSATLFGGVNYNTDSTEHIIWTYLPGTLSEIDSIHSSIQDDIAVQYFAKDDATEDHFKEVVIRSQFLHIATHGFFYPDPELVMKETRKEQDESDLEFRGGGRTNYGIWNFVSNKNPLMRSGIALAGANDMWDRSVFEEGEDGVLTAQEVTTLNMRNTDLVVLSACETGLGDIRGSEGVYGLQRAFKIAGVRFLIMSLWQVPDKETAEFMSIFYKKLFDQRDIRQAFSATQNEMRAKYDPYFWAAFVLIE